jgi:membrane associated rhomboid family serine protease
MDPIASATTGHTLRWRDALVRQLLGSGRPDTTAGAWLGKLDPEVAAVVFPARATWLLLLPWPEHFLTPGPVLRQRILPLVQGDRPGTTRVVIVGGGTEARQLADELQDLRPRGARLSYHQVSEDGSVWNGADRFKPLELAAATLQQELRQGAAPHAMDSAEIAAAREAFQQLARAEEATATLLRQRRPPATLGLIAALVMVYALEMAWGAVDSPHVLYRMGAASRSALLQGQWWRLVTPAFLHANPLHIGVNAWSLWALGVLIEPLFGSARFIALYAFSAVVAACASTFAGAGMSVGASGAIFGLMGALVAVALRPRGLLPASMIAGLRRSLWPPLILNTIISTRPGIDWHAHLGGAVAGFLLVGSGALTRGVLPVGLRTEGRGRSVGWNAVAAVTVAVMAFALGYGLWSEKPWDHSLGPSTRVTVVGRRSIGSRSLAGLSVEMPTQLAEQREVHHEAHGQEEVIFGGRLETELTVSVTIAVPRADAPTVPEQIGQALLDEAEDLHDSDTTFKVTEKPSLTFPPEGPLVTFTETRDGLQNKTWLTWRPEGVVIIAVFSEAEVSPEWQAVGPTLVESLRSEPDAPPL